MPRHLCLVLAALGGACGSSGPSTPAPDGGPDARPGAGGGVDARPGPDAAATGNCQVSWLEDGTARCSIVAVAGVGVSNTSDSLEITAADALEHGVIILIGATHPFATPQSFTCGTPTPQMQVTFAYMLPGNQTANATSCSVTVTDLGAVGGANARGTFSAVVAGPGGSKALTNGTFDIPRRPQ